MLGNDRGESLGKSARFEQFKNFWFAVECGMQSNTVKCENTKPVFVKYKIASEQSDAPKSATGSLENC
jgi:hypothetical protein